VKDVGPSAARGDALLQFLVFAAAVTLTITLAATLPDPGPGALVLVFVSVAIGVACAAGEIRADPLRAAQVGAVLGAGFALIFGLVLWYKPPPTPGPVIGLVIATACVVAGIAATIHLRKQPETFPNLLAERFGSGAVLEADGIQFVVLSSGWITAEAPGSISLYLQNTWSASRQVTFGLRGRLRGRRLIFPEEPEVTLGPLEVGLLTIPIGAHPGEAAQEEVVGSLSARGTDGRRLRRWRAREAQRQISPAFQILGLAAGVVAWGGGIPCPFQIAGARAGVQPSLPAPHWETLWTPQAAEAGPPATVQ
jgi:hypothetical protein